MGNTEGQVRFRNADSPSQQSVTGYSNIEGSESGIDVNSNGSIIWGVDNFNVDSRFVDSQNNNYNLLASSKLINAGHPDSLDGDGTGSILESTHTLIVIVDLSGLWMPMEEMIFWYWSWRQ